MGYAYEMVVCIINAGHSQDVVDAARKAGATGATVVKARGTANAKAEKLFGIPIQPEKEMVLSIVKAEIKDDVLRTLYQNCGLESEGQGIAFSLPVENVVGLKEITSDAKTEKDAEKEKKDGQETV
jgi:nitrogen regulatory protein PII